MPGWRLLSTMHCPFSTIWVLLSSCGAQVTAKGVKIIIYIERKTPQNFVIISENVLDIWVKGWYYYLARVGGICGFSRKTQTRTAMMREIARKRGNFRGVCPVIGRLNCLSALAYIAAP